MNAECAKPDEGSRSLAVTLGSCWWNVSSPSPLGEREEAHYSASSPFAPASISAIVCAKP